jgi:magnesium-protoporphyrin O-methyltransferase
MIHYPQDKADAMVQHLASLAEKRIILSFAPKTLYYSVLKRIGELFPGPSKVGVPPVGQGVSSYRATCPESS